MCVYVYMYVYVLTFVNKVVGCIWGASPEIRCNRVTVFTKHVPCNPQSNPEIESCKILVWKGIGWLRPASHSAVVFHVPHSSRYGSEIQSRRPHLLCVFFPMFRFPKKNIAKKSFQHIQAGLQTPWFHDMFMSILQKKGPKSFPVPFAGRSQINSHAPICSGAPGCMGQRSAPEICEPCGSAQLRLP